MPLEKTKRHNTTAIHLSVKPSIFSHPSIRLSSPSIHPSIYFFSICPSIDSMYQADVESLPLDLDAFCSVNVVAFSVRGKVLSVGWRGWLIALGILFKFQPFCFCTWLVTELYQSHHHGQPQSTNQNIEDTSHIAQAQSACLVLREVRKRVSLSCSGEHQTEFREPAILHSS